ncbi:MAG: helix-turn-helix transcriptional regulator [Clostridia bacterium]|nr:helix-turn-helix transcriptional regulator [Clostridia bacterium]
MIFEKQNRFPENLKSLKEARGCTYEQLGQAISPESRILKETISKWISGSVKPSHDMLYRIAQYFDVTMEQLLYADFSNIPSEKRPVTHITLLDIHKAFLLYITSPEAEKDIYFHKGYQLTCIVWNKMAEGKSADRELYGAIDYYDQSIQHNHTPESACNLISCLLLLWCNIYNDKIKDNLQKRLNGADISGVIEKAFIGETPFLTPEELHKRELFLCICDESLNNYLMLLKNSEKYSPLADFYLAVRYMFSCIVNDSTHAINRKIGREMMLSFAKSGNMYALNWCKFVLDWHEQAENIAVK